MRLARRIVVFASLLAAIAVSSRAPQAGAAPNGTATIVGRLVKAYVPPGKKEAADNGIGGATIEVVPTTWAQSALPPITEPVVSALATVTSAADGTFRIDGLPAGRLGLVVRAAGFATELFPGFRTTDGCVLRAMTLVCEDKARDFAARIVRKDGGPVGGLEIVAWRYRDDLPLFGRREVVRTRTAADGSFRLTGTADYPEVVLVTGPNSYLDLNVRRRWRDAAPATIEVGGDATLDVLAVDSAGNPVSGARVRVLCDGLLEARTEASGHCVFAGVKAGEFLVVADAPGLASQVVAGAGPSLFGETQSPEHKPLASGRNERKLVLQKTAGVSGTVVDRAGGAPVAGARVRFAMSLSVIFGGSETTTDAAGKFTLRDVPVGAGVVVADKEWWRQTEIREDAPWEFLREQMQGGPKEKRAAPTPAVVVAEGGAADVRIAIDRCAPLAVEVRDGAGKPVAGVHIAVLGRSSGEPKLTVGNHVTFAPYLPVWNEVYADDSGRAAVDLPIDGAKLFVDAPDFPQTCEEIDPAKPRPAGPLVVTMRRLANCEVRVVDAAGRPVPGAYVWMQELNDPFRRRDGWQDAEMVPWLREQEPRTADAAGKVAESCWPGAVLVVAGRPGLLGTKFLRANVQEGSPATIEMKLVPAGSVDGRAEQDGKSPAKARVRIFEVLPPSKDGERREKSQWTDVEVRTDGTFHADCAAAGRIALVAYVAREVASGEFEVDAQSDPVEVDVQAGPATKVAAPLVLKPAR